MSGMAERSDLKQLFEHRWPTVDWAVAQLAVRLDQIAASNKLAVENWIEDGLGETAGCTLQLASGLVVQLVERAHAVSHLGAHGPDLYADAKEVQRVGNNGVLTEVMVALGLNLTDVGWQNESPTAADIARFDKAAFSQGKKIG
jgi:hypothetical protein